MDLPIPLWWLEFDAKLKEQKALKEAAGGKSSNTGFSSADWAEARRKHSEKMKNGK